MAIRPKIPAEHRETVTGVWRGGALVEARARSHTILIDEPPDRGGKDAGPSPLEYVLAAYAGCTAIIIERIARERDFRYTGLEVRATSQFSPQAIAGLIDARPDFQAVHTEVRMRTAEPAERVEEVKALLKKRCPVYNMFLHAGARMTEEWTITP